MSRLNILPEEILIKIYKECFKDTLLELQQYHIRKNLYNDVIEEINDICEEVLYSFDFEDIVESEDSDFDSERATKSTDILIKPSQKSPFENYEEKRDVLEVLRQTLSNDRSEEDFIVRMDKQDRKNRR